MVISIISFSAFKKYFCLIKDTSRHFKVIICFQNQTELETEIVSCG